MIKADANVATGGFLRARNSPALVETAPAPCFIFESVCRAGPGGPVKWRETFRNLVTTAGKNLLGEVMFRATAKSAAWYVGLKGVGAIAASNTMSSHAPWTELTDYAETVRQTLTMAAFSAGSATNAAAPAVFNITAAMTLAGAIVVNNSSKGGPTGTLYSAGDLATPRTLENGDEYTVNLILTF